MRGYDPLRAGVATLPFAIVTGAVSPLAITLMKRIGTKATVAAGLALMSAGFVVAAGTAVNDTTREVGGDARRRDRWLRAELRVRQPPRHGADEAPGGRAGRGAGAPVRCGGPAVAGHLPAGVRGPALTAVRSAYVAGLHQGSLVAAGATAVAALGALIFLPARARQTPAARAADRPSASDSAPTRALIR